MGSSGYPNALYACLGIESGAVSGRAGSCILRLGPHLLHQGRLRIAALGVGR